MEEKGTGGKPPPALSRAKGTVDEIREFCLAEKIPESDAVWFFNKCEGNGWQNSGKAIRDWRATLRAWQAGRYLPSQKNGARGNAPNSISESIKPPIFEP